MAITTTLSRLKNYFIGWHTANYRTLHEFTDQITEDEPDGSKLVESKTIFRYIRDLLGDKNTPSEDTVWGNIGIQSCKNVVAYRTHNIKTLWGHICSIWSTIGEWAEEGDPNDWTSFWNLSYTNNSEWNPPDEWGTKGWTIKGWIRKLYYATETLKPKVSTLETQVSTLQTEMRYARQICIMDTAIDNPNHHSRHHIAFYRVGAICYIRGWIGTRNGVSAYASDDGEMSDMIFVISASQDSGKNAWNSDWAPFVPASSVYLNFNHRLSSAADHYHNMNDPANPGHNIRTHDNGSHEHTNNNSQGAALRTGSTNNHTHSVPNTNHAGSHDHAMKETSYDGVYGINSVQLNVGTKMSIDPDANMFTLVVSGKNIKNKKIWITGTYLAKYRNTIYGDKRFARTNEKPYIHDVTPSPFNSDFPDVGNP